MTARCWLAVRGWSCYGIQRAHRRRRFVLEELVRRFDTRTTVVTFGASAGAIAVARLFLGDAPDFHVEPLPYPGFGTVPIHLALGIVAGCAGVAYNRALLGTLAVADRLHRWPMELRAALVGAAVALLVRPRRGRWWGRDHTAHALRTETVAMLSVVFLVRFGLGPLSYAAGTPGGLFAPILRVPERSFVRKYLLPMVPATAPNPTALAVVGMAAFSPRWCGPHLPASFWSPR